MYKMKDDAVRTHMAFWFLYMVAFAGLLFSPRLLVRWLGKPLGTGVWLLGLTVLAGIIFWMFLTGTDANGFLD